MAEKETGRLEAFSDGVFSIAMTLLIMEIKLPPLPPAPANDEVLRALGALWPFYLVFCMSFITILIMWINHHSLFRLVHTVTHPLLFANGSLLLVVTFVNFPTKVLADQLDHSGANVAVAFYCGTYVLVALSYNLLLYTAVPNMLPQVQHGAQSPVPRLRLAYQLGALVYTTATVVAFYVPHLGLTLCLRLWVLWTVLPYRPGAPSVR